LRKKKRKTPEKGYLESSSCNQSKALLRRLYAHDCAYFAGIWKERAKSYELDHTLKVTVWYFKQGTPEEK